MYDPARDAWNSSNAVAGKESGGEPGSTPDANSHSPEPGTPDAQSAAKTPPMIETPASAVNHSLPTPKGDEINLSTVSETATGNSKDSEPSESGDSRETRPIDATKLPRFKRKRRSDDSKVDTSESETSVPTTDRENAEGGISNGTADNHEEIDRTSATHTHDDDEEAEPIRKLKKPKLRASKEVQELRAKEQREREEKRAVNDQIRQHYNARPNTSTVERKKSPIIHLRAFNNFIKSVLIQKYGSRNSVVLDIGIGKGGDLQKWSKQEIEGLIGIDIADVSVDQARIRYDGMRFKPFWADFCVGDAFGQAIEDIVHPDAFPVDLVSSQFTMHYAFANEHRARKLLDNVSRALRPGGKFIGTIPNSDVIAERIKSLAEGEKKFGNSCYTVDFPNIPPTDFRPPFGHEYFFYLEDAVGNVPEYVVPFEAFRGLAQEYGLELIYKKPFLDMFDEETKRNPRLYDLCSRMGVVNSGGNYGIDGDEREACGFYLAFAFSKVR